MKKKETMPEKQVKPQDIIATSIRNSDIKDIAIYNSILFKLMSGIIMISNVYARLISTIFPILKIIDPSEENSDLIRRKFFSVIKAYMRSSSLLEPDKQSLLTEKYSVDVHSDSDEGGIAILSIEYLHLAYKKFIDDIRIMAAETDINLWSNKFNIIEDDLRSIYNEIISFEEDIQSVYIDSKLDIFNTSELEENKNKVSIKSLTDISNYAMETLSCLDDTFLIINEIIYSMAFCIDIKDPMHIYESMDDMYQSYHDMNSEDLESSFDSIDIDGNKYSVFKSNKNNPIN